MTEETGMKTEKSAGRAACVFLFFRSLRRTDRADRMPDGGRQGKAVSALPA